MAFEAGDRIWARIELDVIDPTVECTDCGKCCSEMKSPPFILDYEEDAAWLKSAPEEAQRLFFDDTLGRELEPCSWLDLIKKQCRYYEHRPGVCRDFLVGSRSCKAWRMGEPVNQES